MNKVAYKEQISIITPVFNRLKELTRLYKSLRTQNNNNFIWIIVDDGSEKTINEIVDIWKKESKFKIDLIVQSNQGKMHAYKNAMKRLNKREKHIIDLRFFEGKTQMEVAEEIHISQAQVSRLEKSALKTMRNYLTT